MMVVYNALVFEEHYGRRSGFSNALVVMKYDNNITEE